MTRSKVLLVGFEYTGPDLENTLIETRGLCAAASYPLMAARPLYDYDVIIIYPRSYSHFLFGRPTSYSEKASELWDLKAEDNGQDLDNCFSRHERENELNAALKNGTRVIWLATPDKKTHFFGDRSVYLGYVNRVAAKIMEASSLSEKTSAKLTIEPSINSLNAYFEVLSEDGWQLCWEPWGGREVEQVPLATTPDGYWLGAEIVTASGTSWMLTPPPTEKAINALVQCSLQLHHLAAIPAKYHGIFLSHTHEDKPFVRRLRDALAERGVTHIWVDEAEIMIGDSLIHKIQEGVQQTEYFGVVLSPRSVTSQWVQRELEQAMTLEIRARSVKVLPLMLETCTLPGFLEGKLYADFTTEAKYEEELHKLLRRLQRRH